MKRYVPRKAEPEVDKMLEQDSEEATSSSEEEDLEVEPSIMGGNIPQEGEEIISKENGDTPDGEENNISEKEEELELEPSVMGRYSPQEEGEETISEEEDRDTPDGEDNESEKENEQSQSGTDKRLSDLQASSSDGMYRTQKGRIVRPIKQYQA